ncbi:phosphotransferase enzyme family-domain-containing protein [Amanita rubescens]|nr:phosphotransferase enzyme family-domain-containing protein [Amanita rubescens]
MIPHYMSQPRFIWESGIWGPIPRWLSPPDVTAIESVARKHLRLSASDHISATFFAEGAFNKLFAITVSNNGSTLVSPQYIFRATAPVEPFFKTAGEVATHSYLQEHTSIPVPRIIAHSSTSDNEVGCEWTLMEKVPGVALADAWSDIDLETKSKVTRSVVGYVRQLRDLRCFTGIGNLYFREEINTFNAAVRVLCTEDEKYVLGPLVTPYMFAGGRKLRVPRDLGPYSNDAEYIASLAASELEDMKLLLSPDSRLYSDFDEDLAEDAEDIIQVLNKLQPVLSVLFPSQPRNFALQHHDLSLRNILVDPATYQITGIIDWECVGTRPHWEDPYPQFLLGPEITEEIEPLAPGDTDAFRVERWENWEKTKLRLVFDRELGEARHDDDGRDKIRREFRRQLDIVGVSPGMAQDWIQESSERCTNV